MRRVVSALPPKATLQLALLCILSALMRKLVFSLDFTSPAVGTNKHDCLSLNIISCPTLSLIPAHHSSSSLKTIIAIRICNLVSSSHNLQDMRNVCSVAPSYSQPSRRLISRCYCSQRDD